MGILKQSGEDEIAYSGRILEIVKRPMADENKEIVFEIARRAPGVRLIIIDREKFKVLLTKEHRYEINGFDYRLPGGKVVDSLAEFHELLKSGDVKEAARKKAFEEAKEEAGIEVSEVQEFHVSVVGTTVEWDLHYFVVDDFKMSEKGQQLEHGEEIETGWYDFETAREMCLDGRVSEERSALVLLRYIADNGAK